MRKFQVYIIESPGTEEFYRKSFEGESLGKTLKLSGIESSHTFTININKFKEALSVDLIRQMTKNNEPVILHISAHGNKQGIAFTSNEVIDW